jgi:hypothetical protein
LLTHCVFFRLRKGVGGNVPSSPVCPGLALGRVQGSGAKQRKENAMQVQTQTRVGMGPAIDHNS